MRQKAELKREDENRGFEARLHAVQPDPATHHQRASFLIEGGKKSEVHDTFSTKHVYLHLVVV